MLVSIISVTKFSKCSKQFLLKSIYFCRPAPCLLILDTTVGPTQLFRLSSLIWHWRVYTDVIYLIFLKLEICPWEINSFTKRLTMRFYFIKSLNQALCERVSLKDKFQVWEILNVSYQCYFLVLKISSM